MLIAGDDARAIKAAIDSINKLTETFATRRMDKTIRAALAGQKLSDLKV
jgi:molecular chaperone HscA